MDTVSQWVGAYGYAGVFMAMLIETIFPPIPSELVLKWFDKHGTKAVFLARMTPGMRELISIPAGLSKMNFIKYVIFTFAGSLIWSISLTLLGYFFGDKVLGQNDGSNNLSHIFNYVAIIVIFSLVGFIIYKLIKSKKSE